jgi:hypothetical protein
MDAGKEQTYQRLISLVNPTQQQIKEVIGNGSWTRLKCDECGKEVQATIEVGQEPDYESATANLCIDCLRKALEKFEGALAHDET